MNTTKEDTKVNIPMVLKKKEANSGTTEVYNLATKLDKLSQLPSFTHAVVPLKGFQVKTIVLLLAIVDEYIKNAQGESQIFFKEMFNWNGSTTSTHTSTLVMYGFVMPQDDERDIRKQAKRLVPTADVLNELGKIMKTQK